MQLDRIWRLRKIHAEPSGLVLSNLTTASIRFETNGEVRGDDGVNKFSGLYRYNSATGALRLHAVRSTVTVLANPTADDRLIVRAIGALSDGSQSLTAVSMDNGQLVLRTNQYVLTFS